MLAALAQAAGTSVAQNRSGSNLLQGVTSVAVREADLRGRMDARLLLLEVDEATMRRAAPEVAPDMVLITNIFRDQLDRFGELYSMARMLEAAIEALPGHASVVLNGDDPLVASFAPARPRPGACTSACAWKTRARRSPSTPRTRSAACTASTPSRTVAPTCPTSGITSARGAGPRGRTWTSRSPGSRRHRTAGSDVTARDAGRNRAGARAAAGTAQRVQRRRRARRRVRAGDAGAGQRAVRSRRPAPGVRAP